MNSTYVTVRQKMKTIAFLMVLLLAFTSAAIARSFSYAVYIHQVDGVPKVDIHSKLPETHREHLSITEAIAFLQKSPKSRGPNGIGILVDFGCDGSEILKVVQESPDMELIFFQDFAADGIRRSLYEARETTRKQQKVEQGQ
jgi:hypothetical protein